MTPLWCPVRVTLTSTCVHPAGPTYCRGVFVWRPRKHRRDPRRPCDRSITPPALARTARQSTDVPAPDWVLPTCLSLDPTVLVTDLNSRLCSVSITLTLAKLLLCSTRPTRWQTDLILLPTDTRLPVRLPDSFLRPPLTRLNVGCATRTRVPATLPRQLIIRMQQRVAPMLLSRNPPSAGSSAHPCLCDRQKRLPDLPITLCSIPWPLPKMVTSAWLQTPAVYLTAR